MLDLNVLIPGCKNFKWGEVFVTNHDRDLLIMEFEADPNREDIKENAIAIAGTLQAVRDILGFPIPISSWYRSQRVEDIVGGKGNHIKGDAVDLKISTTNIKKVVNLLQNHNGGMGFGKHKLHIDRGHKRRWEYLPNL